MMARETPVYFASIFCLMPSLSFAQEPIDWVAPQFLPSLPSTEFVIPEGFMKFGEDYYSAVEATLNSGQYLSNVEKDPTAAQAFLGNVAALNSPIVHDENYSAFQQIEPWARAMVVAGTWDGSLAQEKFAYGLTASLGGEYFASSDLMSRQKDIFASFGIDDPRDKVITGDPTGVPIETFLKMRSEKMSRLQLAADTDVDCSLYADPMPEFCMVAEDQGFDAKNLFFLTTFEKKSTPISKGVSAVAIMVSRDGLKINPDGNYQVITEPNTINIGGTDLPICPGTEYPDRYRTAGGYCSGFLTKVGEHQVFVTAAHCAVSLRSNWTETQVVFGLSDPILDESPVVVEARQVFRLSQLVDLGWEFNRKRENDFAVFFLDRAVDAEVALPVEMNGDVRPVVGSLIALVGYPGGMTQKIDHAIEKGEPVIVSYFGDADRLMLVATDSNHGNSGAPIFLASDGKVAGILVAGQSDYVLGKDEVSGSPCATPNRILEIARYMETALFISRVTSSRRTSVLASSNE